MHDTIFPRYEAHCFFRLLRSCVRFFGAVGPARASFAIHGEVDAAGPEGGFPSLLAPILGSG